MAHPHNNLFDGITAVADAGGVDGFAREVLAETKTLGFKRLRQDGVSTEREARAVFDQALTDVVIRRIESDCKRAMKDAALEALAHGDPNAVATRADLQAVNIAIKQAGERMMWTIHALCDEINRVHKR